VAGADAALALAALTEEASAAAAAKGGAHAGTGPANGLWKGASLSFKEAGWDACTKGNGLVWVNTPNGFGVCPQGGSHNPKGTDYKLIRLR